MTKVFVQRTILILQCSHACKWLLPIIHTCKRKTKTGHTVSPDNIGAGSRDYTQGVLLKPGTGLHKHAVNNILVVCCTCRYTFTELVDVELIGPPTAIIYATTDE